MKDFEFMEKFRPTDLCIKNFKYWLVCIRRKQTTLGAAVILLKRNITNLGEMTKEETEEFPKVIKWYENLCKEKFQAIKFNYIIMMMKDNFIHYHAFPRYDRDIELFDKTWVDNEIDYTLNNYSSTEIANDELLFKIRDYMCKR